VCAYRRPEIARTLESLAALRLGQGLALRVIVADNDEDDRARAMIDAMAREFGLDLHYVHAPQKNISIARNACLDAASGDWLGFVDDDETVAPQWMEAMLGEAEHGGWDAVLGPVDAVYPETAPAWLRQGAFHSTRPVVVGAAIRTGYTGNVMMRRDFIARAGLRFDPARGRTGGEDLDFFYRLTDAGGRIGYAPAAVAFEPVPAARLSFGWLARRNFRAGQSHGARIAAASPAGRAGQSAVAAAKAAVYLGRAAVNSFSPVARNRSLLRAAMHGGALARLLGVGEIVTY
jgi:succinoglycan biosynthesis protein ExoM